MTGEIVAVRVLLVSRDVQAIKFLSDQIERLSMQMETCCDTQSATKRLCRAKFEGVIVDLELGEHGFQLLEKLRDLTSHRHAISYAIAENPEQAAAAFRSHANFALQRPLTSSSVLKTFRAAYPMMLRERRRGYRYPIEVPTLVAPTGAEQFWSTSINISESGMAFCSSTPLTVGERVRLELQLPAFSDQLVLSAEICWNINGRAGMRFVNVPAALAERLQCWLSEKISALVPVL